MLQTVYIKSAWPAKTDPTPQLCKQLHLCYATRGIRGSKAWIDNCSSLETCQKSNQEDPVCAAKTAQHKCCNSLQKSVWRWWFAWSEGCTGCLKQWKHTKLLHTYTATHTLRVCKLLFINHYWMVKFTANILLGSWNKVIWALCVSFHFIAK